MIDRFRTTCLLLVLFFLPAVLSPDMIRAQEVFVGVVLPMSGTHAAFGHMQKNSMLMAVEEINSRGGINGDPLHLDVRDSGGQPGNARAIVDHFVKDKQYPLVLGGFTSSVAAALAEKCEQRRIPMIVVTGSEDAITLQDYRYVFRLSPPRSRYPAAALDYARSTMQRASIALITEHSTHGDAMAYVVKQVAREKGWAVQGEWKFDLGSRNLESIYSGAVKAQPDAVFVTAFPPEGARIIQELKKNLPGTILFNLTPASTMTGSYTRCGVSCEGVLHPALWVPETVPSGARYRDSYHARFGLVPDYHGAQAYAAVIVAAQAVRRAGAAQPEPVRAALETVAVNTPYGKVSFSNWGGFTRQNDPPNYLVKWNGDAFELIWPKGP